MTLTYIHPLILKRRPESFADSFLNSGSAQSRPTSRTDTLSNGPEEILAPGGDTHQRILFLSVPLFFLCSAPGSDDVPVCQTVGSTMSSFSFCSEISSSSATEPPNQIYSSSRGDDICTGRSVRSSSWRRVNPPSSGHHQRHPSRRHSHHAAKPSSSQ